MGRKGPDRRRLYCGDRLGRLYAAQKLASQAKPGRLTTPYLTDI